MTDDDAADLLRVDPERVGERVTVVPEWSDKLALEGVVTEGGIVRWPGVESSDGKHRAAFSAGPYRVLEESSDG